MANQWLRLWHEMPNDPKWRTIARVSKQPVSLVLAVFLHLMVDASRNVTRGHASVTLEDLASALDCDEAQIEAIFDAMQGRVLEDMVLLGWDKRQPKREDAGNAENGVKSAAERKRAQRQREKDAIKNNATDGCVTNADGSQADECHVESRDVTLDKDKDKDKDNSPSLRSGESADKPRPTPGRKKSEAKTLATYLAECKAAGVKPVPDGHAARTWAEEAGIADEMLQIAWVQFRERYTEGEKGKGKRYKDWAGHFATAIKGNWFKLWFAGDEGAMCWTSNGLTHKAVLDARMARQRPTQEVSHAPA